MSSDIYKEIVDERSVCPGAYILGIFLWKDSFFHLKSEKRVETEPFELITRDITKKYNDNPLGWKILLDHKGTMLVLGPRKGYMLKLISLSPEEQTGVGIRIESLDEIRKLVDGLPFYGFRPLSLLQAKKLITEFRCEKQSNIISKILMQKPIRTTEIENKEPRVVLQGPVISHPDLSTISRRQSELESKLRIEAEKLFRKRYPKRAEIYS